MFRTFYVASKFIWDLALLTPRKMKLERLQKEGNIKESADLISITTNKWAKQIIQSSGVEIEAIGLENIPDGPVVFVSNHQGYFDIPVLFSLIDKPASFIAKKELGTIPIFGKWMELTRCIFIDRGNKRQSLQAIKDGIALLKEGHSLVIFPEGTRSKSSDMKDFKKGSLKLATKAKVPIVPVCIDGTYKVFEANNGKKITPAKVKVTFCDPIFTDNITKEEDALLNDKVEGTVRKNLLSN
ncbi:MAG: 1-acyl-sn-glycerol-3-phosphate acyltransferase [Anaeromicrobium sp.]|jgi:1-acyl-sn-glycerol-3-phosphate acyltransferase|uniref:lysophospholipid acyltransferase family protein n=1 Tax=Anaeromicrobium sp. TaxID=1929132 RepID=UPI0025CDE28E|nr:lysophospholipid acyltransferase family protein [Anaeromicrobium sp.]MCT4595216.1 1-acyl-sn-glycerol-3-phosphate acyltransferase [Anaeromicrobium sp.]